MSQLSREKVQKALAAPNGSTELAAHAEAAFPAAWELFCGGLHQAAAFLFLCARKRVFAARIEELLGQERAPLLAALSSKEPKLRKNAARLAGALKNPQDEAPLIAALDAETVRYVRPSLLLALGALGTPGAEARLKSHAVPRAASAEDKKHAEKEREALATALTSYRTAERHGFCGLKAPVQVLLRTADRLSGSLLAELNALGVTVLESGADFVRVQTADLPGLYDARSFSEALVVLFRGLAADPKNVALRIKRPLEALLASCHENPVGTPFSYRIELRGEELDRGAFARELASLLDGQTLQNSPRSYEAELRLELRPGGGMNAYVKLFSVPDTRFAYRLEALPASIHPSTAAAVLRHAAGYLSPGARVLDPCCGSGTLLIERALMGETASLTGVDIAHAAVDIARKNARAAAVNAKFIANDCLRFEAERPYDEVVANLPFGNRVGSHKANIALYAGILDALPRWLRRGGVAVLYTMEFTLLKKLVRERNHLKLETECRTSAGGLMPGIFILTLRP